MSPAHDPTAHAHHEEEGHNRAGERRTRVVVLLTFIVMTVELVIGHYTDSMALTADGWHMGTHVGALGLTLAAYWYARTRASADTFAFGTGKVYALAGYTSGILLAGVAIWMAVEGIERLFEHPVIHFGQALPIAAAGLVVNLISAKLLGHSHHYGHDHGHDHGHSHGAAAGHDHDHAGHDHAGHDHDGHDHDGHDHDGHDHDGHDHAGHDHAGHDHVPSAAATTTETATAQGNLDFNLRAAYIHILADAMTSLLAIAALTLGYFFDLWFLDPAMGIVGGGVILWWTVSLCRQASRQLLDVASSPDGERVVRARLEGIDDVRVADLHVWELGPGRRSCIVSIVTAAPRQLDYYRDVVLRVLECAHLTIEIHTCDLAHTAAAAAVPRELQVAHRHEH